MREWPDDNRRWVIVFNMQSLITPIRHIIELHAVEYNEAEFADWYYERYNKLEGDEFAYIASTKKMREKEAEIVKKYDEAMSTVSQPNNGEGDLRALEECSASEAMTDSRRCRRNWKEHCAKNAEKRSEAE